MAMMKVMKAMKAMKKPAAKADEELDFKVVHVWGEAQHEFGHIQMEKKQTLEDTFFGLCDTQYNMKDYNDVMVALHESIFWVDGKTADPRKTLAQLKIQNGDIVKIVTKEHKVHAHLVMDVEAPAPKPKFQPDSKHGMMPPDDDDKAHK